MHIVHTRHSQEHARRIAKVTNECKLPLEVEKYVDKFKPSMMGIVLAWCNGSSFVDVCKIADIFEGVLDVHAYIDYTYPRRFDHSYNAAIGGTLAGDAQCRTCHWQYTVEGEIRRGENTYETRYCIRRQFVSVSARRCAHTHGVCVAESEKKIQMKRTIRRRRLLPLRRRRRQNRAYPSPSTASRW